MKDRRQFLIGSAAWVGAAAGLAAGGGEKRLLAETAPAAPGGRKPETDGAFPMPGAFRGKVVEVAHPGSVVDGKVNREAVREMMRRGMLALTSEKEPVAAWRRFFAKGDVVGIKVNPVGQPHAISNHAVVLEIIDNLRQAGLPAQDILVFDRYRDQFVGAGYRDILPEGVRWDAAAPAFDGVQLAIDGYDPDVFLDLPLVGTGIHDPSDPRARRSHVALIVTKKVTKIINVPVLKDHGTGGVTLALKNMSHGLVNNVARSHAAAEVNACGQFIPAVVALPAIRGKVVLHILDGLKAVYEGGPSATPRHVWERKTLSFATDPVAMDRLGWEVIDAKRKEMGLPPVGESKWQGVSWRQPEHILFAGALGLGESDRAKIEQIRVALET
jgi:Domain of unknown function (DUF362)